MKSEEEVIGKYPKSVVEKYFNDGTLFNWDEEYFEIAWTYPSIILVILDLYRNGIIIKHIDVLVKNDILTLINDDWPGLGLPSSFSADKGNTQRTDDEDIIACFLKQIYDFQVYKDGEIGKYYFSLFF